MASIEEKLTEMLAPTVEALGYELLGIEYLRSGRHSTLRLFIDHANGISVDDCATVSHQVSGVLDVEDPISSEYHLEVSSPGMDRPLFSAAQFARFVGQDAQVQLRIPMQNRRKWKGEIQAVDGEMITLLVDGQAISFAFPNVAKANIVPRFD